MVQITSEEDNQAKVRWRCRRGMLELDYILLSFFDNEYADLSGTAKSQFNQLLSAEDQDLQRWLIGNQLPEDSKLQDLVLAIKYLTKNIEIKPV